MSINSDKVDLLFASCHRRCCICHRFCGVRMEVHHIKQSAFNGSDDAENLVPLCFDCHAEVGHYNTNHPKGRKYQPNELRLHREQWISICKNNSGVLIANPASTEAGPLQSLLGELEFNLIIVQTPGAQYGYPCPISSEQFERVISEGSMLVLPLELKDALLQLYCKLWGYNVHVRGFENKERSTEHSTIDALRKLIQDSHAIEDVIERLRSLLNGSHVDVAVEEPSTSNL